MRKRELDMKKRAGHGKESGIYRKSGEPESKVDG
jgi:hypothetical protein